MLAVLTVIAALVVTPAFAEMNIFKGQPYEVARAEIVGDGWQPSEQRHENVLRDCGSREPCKVYPETVACSGTGKAFCAFEFHKDGRTLKVVTRWEDPELDHWTVE